MAWTAPGRRGLIAAESVLGRSISCVGGTGGCGSPIESPASLKVYSSINIIKKINEIMNPFKTGLPWDMQGSALTGRWWSAQPTYILEAPVRKLQINILEHDNKLLSRQVCSYYPNTEFCPG